LGQAHYRKIVVLVIVFSVTSFLIYHTPSSKPVNKKEPLLNWLTNIYGWGAGEHIPLDPEIVEALDLDDYANQYYFKEKENVFLYVGYYLTTEKLGAPHSPLVCFHGAGWTISQKEKRRVNFKGNKLDFMSAIVTRGRERQLLLYWFQAFDRTFPGTFFQKLYAFWTKWLHGREDNAFVRVSLPVEEPAPDAAMRTGMAFLEAFYPIFFEYVVSTEQ